MTAYVTEICPHCGNLRSVCSDPNMAWYPQRAVCYVSASLEITRRRVTAKYGHPEPKATEPHQTDGLNWWMAQHDLTPDDHFI
jgi:hypothetical protein